MALQDDERGRRVGLWSSLKGLDSGYVPAAILREAFQNSSGVRSNGAWSDIIGRARLSRQQERRCSMSGVRLLPPKADVFSVGIDVCLVPKADLSATHWPRWL
jgi:hypothetical protein